MRSEVATTMQTAKGALDTERAGDTVPWADWRTVHPGALPQHMAITVLDLDVTKDCNLRCTYCFKGENVHRGASRMSLSTAMAAVDWVIAASYGARQLWVNLFGGEPLLAFQIIRQLVPYAKRKAASHGKEIQFGCTTNLTLIDAEIADFFRTWGMGWHCSIDGPPEVQDRQRPTADGGLSSPAAERGARYALRDRPGAMARATLTPTSVTRVYESVLYFEQLGFSTFGFAIADEETWSAADLREYERQLSMLRAHAMENWYRKGVDKRLSAFDNIIRAHVTDRQPTYSCGAGRGSALVDECGDIWPCHRWDGADLSSQSAGAWRLGNIFRDGFNHDLHRALLDRDRWACQRPKCAQCSVQRLCAGGCPAASLGCGGGIYAQHRTNCASFRIAHRQALLLHDELQAEENELFARKFLQPEDDGTEPGDAHE
jgi:uncharacterized protein